MSAMTHAVERTSPKGGPFIGTCRLCGTPGLKMSDAQEPCPNQRGLSADEALIEAIDPGAPMETVTVDGVEYSVPTPVLDHWKGLSLASEARATALEGERDALRKALEWLHGEPEWWDTPRDFRDLANAAMAKTGSA